MPLSARFATSIAQRGGDSLVRPRRHAVLRISFQLRKLLIHSAVCWSKNSSVKGRWLEERNDEKGADAVGTTRAGTFHLASGATKLWSRMPRDSCGRMRSRAGLPIVGLNYITANEHAKLHSLVFVSFALPLRQFIAPQGGLHGFCR